MRLRTRPPPWRTTERVGEKRDPWTQPTSVSNSPPLQGEYGPVAEYDRRVKSGALRDDQHQRSTFLHSLPIEQELG
jgi:hypothetical protein